MRRSKLISSFRLQVAFLGSEVGFAKGFYLVLEVRARFLGRAIRRGRCGGHFGGKVIGFGRG